VLRVVLGRLVAGLILVLVLTLLTYVVFFRVPVDPVIYIAPSATDEEAAAIREQLGLDQPVLEQWGRFAWHLGTDADLGTSLIGRQSVNEILRATVPPTLSLVLGGFALMLALAIPLGMLAAIRPRSLLDRGVLIFTVVGVILHPFLIGLILKHVFAVRLDLAPGGGYCPLRGTFEIATGPGQFSSCGGVVDWLAHMWMPWVTFGDGGTHRHAARRTTRARPRRGDARGRRSHRPHRRDLRRGGFRPPGHRLPRREEPWG
jgi:peptide/nickel transport system permease protein